MSMNENFRQNSGSEDSEMYERLMREQLTWTKAIIDDWLTNEPWKYGSIDSWDYLMAALQLSHDIVEGIDNTPETLDAFRNKEGERYLWNYACDGVANGLWELLPVEDR